MFVRACLLIAIAGVSVLAEPPGIEVDFLAGYYEQDGENSPVNGGIGSEELTSASPIVVVRFITDRWTYSGTFGLDNITSASIDAMDDNAPEGFNVSSASRKDNRAFISLSAQRSFGADTWRFTVGSSQEYDYGSLSGGVAWSRILPGGNTTVGASLMHYEDTVELYSIHGVKEGETDRTTTDLSLTLSRVLTKRTAGSIELFASDQSGFLSSPFQEVILSDGTHVAERLPDSRARYGARLALNHSWRRGLIHRSAMRYYDDDFGIDSLTLEQELHFALPKWNDAWVYPILRYYRQSGSDYFGEPGGFDPGTTWYTADRDLSELTSTRFGLGGSFALGRGGFRDIDLRLTYYDRDDGLTAFNLSFGLRWSLR